MWKLMRHLFYRRADLVIANSRAAIDAMSRYVPAAHMTWLPNPLRTAPGSDGARYDGPFFLAVGRLTGQKAYDVLIAAFAEIGKLLPGWRLVILGDGPLRDDLTRLSAALGVSEHVQFAGHVGDPFAWYRAAKVFVHAARYEGLPNAVLEAMSEALPVVVTDAQPGLRDFVRDGESGIVVGVDSIPALADAMIRLAKDEGLRRRLGDAARDAVTPCRPDRVVAAWSAALALP
jgi:glycosyltransferase involved in cell wall biosynthesis